MKFALALVSLLAACTDKDVTPADDSTPTVDCTAFSAVDIPAPAGEVGAAWDASHQRFIIFGGNRAIPENCSFAGSDFGGETWAFYPDCGLFDPIEVSDGPGPRGRFAAASDAARGRMLMYGGRYRAGSSGNYTNYDELWSFDYATDTWTLLSSDAGPSPRSSTGMEVVGDQLILFGGNASSSGTAYRSLDDLWSWDLVNGGWTELDAGSGPSARLMHATAASDGAFYVYAGGDNQAFTGPFLGDLWKLDLASMSWTELHADDARAPSQRLAADLFFDPTNERLLMWAGHDIGNLGNNNQLWAFDLGSGDWSVVREGDIYANPAEGTCDFPPDFTTPDFESPERRYMDASDVSEDGRVFIFGGKTDCGAVNDVWSLNMADATWTELSSATAGEICLRAFSECESLCF